MTSVGADACVSASGISRPSEKRLKTVFSKTSEVAAAWAAQDRPTARTGSNTSFRGDTLYSYGTPVARLIEMTGDRRVALISSKRWSSGTSKVQGEARHAAFLLGIAAYEVPRLGASDTDITANLQHFAERIDQSIAAIAKAVRWDTARGHRNEALRQLAIAHLYAADMVYPWTWDGTNPLGVRGAKEDFL